MHMPGSLNRTRPTTPLPPLPPGLDAYRPVEVYGSLILVVEDEVAMRAQLEFDLRDLGYQVRGAGSSAHALQALRQERFAGVLLDLVLERDEESGFELLREIRQTHPGLPVVVLSAAQASSAAVRRAYEVGASGYFIKGSTPLAHIYSDLAARILEGAQRPQGTYRFGQMGFDPAHRSVTLGGKQVRLTSQQTALIVHLAQGSRPATAGHLIEAGLFRPNAARSTVHSALLALRRKLDQLEPGLGSRFLLSTPRGYSLGTIAP
jgi:two-component system, OmpR family, response regulator